VSKGRERGTERVGPTRVALLCLALLALLAAIPAPAAAAANLQVHAVPDVTMGDPGDIVTLTLSMDNVGPANAAKVWANVTLPAGTVYESDNANSLPPFLMGWSSGNRRGYNFTSLPVTNNTFGFSFRILVGPPNGTVLSVTFAVNYTDDTGALQPQGIDVARVTVLIPTLVVTKTPSASPVDPGQSLTYTIVVANTGGASASALWMNDTLPSSVTYSTISPTSFRNQHCPSPPDCSLAGLSAGASQTYSILVTVKGTAARGTTFVNSLFVNFTDSDGTILWPVSVQAYVDVRVINDLTTSTIASPPDSFPGQTVAFTIWYNNTAGVDLGATWLNDTLPVGMTHVSSTPAGIVAGNAVRWQFASVTPGPHSVQLVARVSPTTADRTVLVNLVYGDYYTGAGQKGQRSEAYASVLVSADVPRFDFEKLANVASVRPGGTIRYTIYYNNTGTNTSAEVVIEDTIPAGTVLTNPSATPTSVSGRTYTWRFVSIPAGAAQTMGYDLVLQDAPVDTNLVNAASLTFTDPQGQALPSPPPRSAIVRVSSSNGGGAGDGGPLPWIGGILAAAIVAGVVAYRTTVGRRRTVIDEVFLLHRDGLLIKHYTRRMRPDVDSDILSGMLIAVQNFVNESFIGSSGLQKEGQLDELRFGEFKLVIERGKFVIVAAVLSGDPTNRVKSEVQAAIRDLEAELGSKLDGWTGEMRNVEGADRYMQDLIAGRYRGARGKG